MIVAVGPTDTLEGADAADEVIEASGKLVIPGLIDCHTHLGSAMVFGLDGLDMLRRWGRQQDYFHDSHLVSEDPFSREMRLYVWPVAAWADPERHRKLLTLGHLNAIKHGTTTLSDCSVLPDVMAEVATRSGLRVDLAPELKTAVSDSEGGSPELSLEEADRIIAQWHGAADGRITVRVHPHALYSCDAWFLRECVDLAAAHNVGVGIHMAEHGGEVETVRSFWPEGEVRRAYDLGLMGPNSLFYHSCYISDDDIALFAETGTSVAHCPITNTNTVSLIARVPDLLEAGVTVGLGSDMANNDLFNAMRSAWALHHVNPLGPERIAPWTPLDLATRGSAAALGMGERIGVLAPGRAADIVTVDLTRNTRLIELNPLALVWVLALKGSGNDVRDAIVNGEILMRDRVVPHLDEEQVVADARSMVAEFLSDYEAKAREGIPFVEQRHHLFPVDK